jgi:GNAT superfamily N-acetyltransferase
MKSARRKLNSRKRDFRRMASRHSPSKTCLLPPHPLRETLPVPQSDKIKTSPDANWTLRVACEPDIPALEILIPLSVRSLQAAHYSPAQMEAALGPVFGVDRQIIRDGTYFAVEQQGRIVGCGGWSFRKTLFGGARDRPGEDARLDPKRDAARIRAFFIHPDLARRGIGRSILVACEVALQKAGFQSAELVATLTGEPLYASFDYTVIERYEVPLPGGLTLPVVKMAKRFNSA